MLPSFYNKHIFSRNEQQYALIVPFIAGASGGGVGGSNTPSTKFRSFNKAEPNSQFREKYIRNNLTRIRVSLICKFSGTPD
jgi:hypothetical protein